MAARTRILPAKGDRTVTKAVSGALAAGLALFAAPVAAQTSGSQEVEIIGTAEAFCSLPSSWEVASSTNTVTFSQFSGRTWSIPRSLLANDTGMGIVSNDEVAIRVRGKGTCNTTHTITVTSANGGLARVDSTAAPTGFQRLRKMRYDAHWRDQPTWGVTNFVPSAPGASQVYDHLSRVPPGEREFDIRMGLLRDGTAGPMVAGTYTDQVTVTISIPG
jgi:hypothetical protein